MHQHYFKTMDGTYYKFREIMAMVELTPNDMELGEAVRSYYHTNYKKHTRSKSVNDSISRRGSIRRLT